AGIADEVVVAGVDGAGEIRTGGIACGASSAVRADIKRIASPSSCSCGARRNLVIGNQVIGEGDECAPPYHIQAAAGGVAAAAAVAADAAVAATANAEAAAAAADTAAAAVAALGAIAAEGVVAQTDDACIHHLQAAARAVAAVVALGAGTAGAWGKAAVAAVAAAAALGTIAAEGVVAQGDAAP